MRAHKSQMWATYRYHAYDVMVIQQWHDPFGCPMIRIAVVDDGQDIAEGMPEDRFLGDATMIAEPAPLSD